MAGLLGLEVQAEKEDAADGDDDEDEEDGEAVDIHDPASLPGLGGAAGLLYPGCTRST